MMPVSIQVLAMTVAWLPLALALAATSPAPSVDAGEGSPPRIVTRHYQKEHIIRAGSARVIIECPVESDTDMMITWRKGADEITPAYTRYSVVNRNRRLRIKNVQMVDRGRFSCEAVNGFGRQIVHFVLRVYEGDVPPMSFPTYELDYDGIDAVAGSAPQFVRPHLIRALSAEPIRRKVGAALTLSCDADGQPRPNVIWLLNSVQVHDSRLREMGWRVDRMSISKESLHESDSAMYTCQVINMHGQLEATFDVQVQPNNELHLQPSAFDAHDTHPENVTVPVGGIATFQCKVHSTHKPMMRWLRKIDDEHRHTRRSDDESMLEVMVNGVPMTVAVIDRKYYNESAIDRTHMSKLVLKDVTVDDAGWYICFVTDVSGNLLHRFARLTVDDGSLLSVTSPQQMHIIVAVVCVASFVVMLALISYICRCRQAARDRALIQAKQQRALLQQQHCGGATATLQQFSNGQTALIYQPPPPTCPPPHTPHMNSYKSSPSPMQHHQHVPTSMSSSAYHQLDNQAALSHTPLMTQRQYFVYNQQDFQDDFDANHYPPQPPYNTYNNAVTRVYR